MSPIKDMKINEKSERKNVKNKKMKRNTMKMMENYQKK